MHYYKYRSHFYIKLYINIKRFLNERNVHAYLLYFILDREMDNFIWKFFEIVLLSEALKFYSVFAIRFFFFYRKHKRRVSIWFFDFDIVYSPTVTASKIVTKNMYARIRRHIAAYKTVFTSERIPNADISIGSLSPFREIVFLSF